MTEFSFLVKLPLKVEQPVDSESQTRISSIQTAPRTAENIGEVQISLTAQMKPQTAFQHPIHNQKRLALFSLVCFPSFSDLLEFEDGAGFIQ